MTRALRSAAVLLVAAVLVASSAEAQRVGSVTVDAGGSGYTSAPTVTFSGGGGSGAAAVATLGFGVGSVTGVSGGLCFNLPSVTFDAPDLPGGRRATGTSGRPAMRSDVQWITVTDGGSGYTSPPGITFGPCSSHPSYTVNLETTGEVGSVTVDAGGGGYTSAPSVVFSGGGGSGAAATATLASGVTGVTLASPAVGDTFERGEAIEATVTFDSAVDVTGTPQLALGIAANTRQAAYVSGTGTAALLFRYTVVQADVDSDGLSIGANALTLNGGTIRASAADRTDASLGFGVSSDNQSNRLVDGTRFTAAAASGASITSTPVYFHW